MKRIFLILLALILALLCFSCAQPKVLGDAPSPSAPQNTGSLYQKPENLKGRPPQPIQFDGFENALAFIVNGDLRLIKPRWEGFEPYEYFDAFELWTYDNMVTTFRKEEGLYKVSNVGFSLSNNEVTLFPEVDGEDTGIGCYLADGKIFFQVIVYCVKEGAAYEIDYPAETVKTYFEKRFEIDSTAWRCLNTEHPILSALYVTTYDNSEELYARAMMDEKHYVLIRTDGTENNLLDFVHTLRLDKVDIP